MFMEERSEQGNLNSFDNKYLWIVSIFQSTSYPKDHRKLSLSRFETLDISKC